MNSTIQRFILRTPEAGGPFSRHRTVSAFQGSGRPSDCLFAPPLPTVVIFLQGRLHIAFSTKVGLSHFLVHNIPCLPESNRTTANKHGRSPRERPSGDEKFCGPSSRYGTTPNRYGSPRCRVGSKGGRHCVRSFRATQPARQSSIN